MNILSLFDGVSCCRVALDRANISVKKYSAAEIDKYAIKVSNKNYPDIERLGDVTSIKAYPIDLLVGGSPCQDLSIAKKDRKGLDGDRSSLFWEYVRLKNECKPTYFLFENVASMPKEAKETITKALGVEPTLFNASLVSAQSRKRLFWTNIPFTLPTDRGIVLKDILEPNIPTTQREMTRITRKGTPKGTELSQIGYVGNTNSQGNRVYSSQNKSVCLSSKSAGLYDIGGIRKLTPIECERLQGLPDNYTEGISNTQRYKCLGNAFNVDVITHILSAINNEAFKAKTETPSES